MEQNLEFCIKLFIYSFHNEGQREILPMIDTDLNPFMMDSWLCGCHYLHQPAHNNNCNHLRLKALFIKFVVCVTATNLFPFCDK